MGQTLVASGTVSRPALVLSLADAFVDFSAAGLLAPYADGAHKLVLTDAGGKTLGAYLRAPGVALTRGAELVQNGADWAFTLGVLDAWTVTDATAAAVAGGDPGNCVELTRTGGTWQELTQSLALVDGAAYATSAAVKSGTAGFQTYGFWLREGAGALRAAGVVMDTSGPAWAQAASSLTWPSAEAAIVVVRKATPVAGSMLFDTVSVRRLLTPSADGATVVTAAYGATAGWSEASGFDRTAESYTYAIYRDDDALTPIRTRILNDCVDALEAIDGTGSYRTTLATVTVGPVQATDDTDYPAAWLLEGDESASDSTISQLVQRTLPVTVEAWVKYAPAGADLPTLANRLLMDLERALTGTEASRTRGGYASSTAFTGARVRYDPQPGVLASVEADFVISYVTLLGAPNRLG